MISNLLRRVFNRNLVISPCAIRAGDDLILRVSDRLDSDDSVSILNAVKDQFPGVRLHLVCGDISCSVKRGYGSSSGASGDDGSNPESPVVSPSRLNPLFEAAKSCPNGDVVVITHASALGIVAVYIPPK